jgi:hypothetical protein
MQRYPVFFIAVSAVHVSGGETAQKMYSTDCNKEYCIALQLVGYMWKNTLMTHDPMDIKYQSYVIKIHCNINVPAILRCSKWSKSQLKILYIFNLLWYPWFVPHHIPIDLST